MCPHLVKLEASLFVNSSLAVAKIFQNYNHILRYV